MCFCSRRRCRHLRTRTVTTIAAAAAPMAIPAMAAFEIDTEPEMVSVAVAPAAADAEGSPAAGETLLVVGVFVAGIETALPDDTAEVVAAVTHPPSASACTTILVTVGSAAALCMTLEAEDDAAIGFRSRFGLSNQLQQLSCWKGVCVQLLNWLLQHQWTLPEPMSLHAV